MPPLLADFIHARACKPKCEKFLTRPSPITKPIKRVESFDVVNRLKGADLYMIKAGIITLHFSVNYGAVLQCLALTEILKKDGVEVQVINYYPNYAKYYWEPRKKYLDAIKDGILASYKANGKIKDNVVVRCLKALKYAHSMNCKSDFYRGKYEAFNKFRREYLPLTDEIVDISGLEKLSFDLLITGSDQVWNSDYTNYSFDKAYFLNFGKKNVFRIAYAVSTHLYENNEKWIELLRLIKNIDVISVREENVCKKINEISGQNKAVTVLDPTLLLSASDWSRFEKPCAQQQEYILVYCLHEHDLCLRYLEKIKNFSKRLAVIDISPNKISDASIWKGDCDPGEFLSLVHRAKIVITDSFHGTVFSVIYNKEFISISQNTVDTRICDLLNSVGLSKRYKTIYDDVPFEDIDYMAVNKRLDQLKSYSLDFLLKELRQLKINTEKEEEVR